MKIHLANESRQTMGGGWTFMSNLKEVLKDRVEFTSKEDCDIYFISSASMVNREVVQEMKSKSKKVVLRVDNIPRNSRNRNTGTTRLYDFAQMADFVVFQSNWAKKKLMPLLNAERSEISNQHNNFLYGKSGKKQFSEDRSSIIINGVNTKIFKKEGETIPKQVEKRFMINRFNRDNNKRLEEALDWFTLEWIENKNIEVYLIGQFSRDLVASYFDFYLGENWQIIGTIEDREQLATYYRSCDVLLYPAYSDACPNVVLEARACGMDIWHNGHAGIPEAMNPDLDISLERMGNEYYDLFKQL